MRKFRIFIQNFIKCGILGWCLEIIFTSLQALRRRDYTLRGVTSLWMFPIYGAGCLLTPFFFFFRRLHWTMRGGIYAAFILAAEYLSGSLLWKRGLCPWDYGRARWNISRVIRLDYIPCWAATGLLMERATRDAGSVPRH